MDTSTEELNESMIDVIERAEAYLSAHSALSNQNTLNRSTENLFDSTVTERSIETSHDSSSSAEVHVNGFNNAGDTVKGNSEIPNSSSFAATGNIQTGLNEIEVLSDDSDDTVLYNVVHEEARNSPLNGSTDNEDCIVTAETSRASNRTVATIDLSSTVDDDIEILSQRSRRDRRRRLAMNVPIVESIVLDDTIGDIQIAHNQEIVGIGKSDSNSLHSKRTKTTQEDLDSSSEGGASSNSITCPICFDSIFKNQPSSTICGHLFCYPCINYEIQLRKKCPMCKRKLTRSQVHPIYIS